MSRNSLAVTVFSQSAVENELKKSGHRSMPAQAEYISRYCDKLGAHSIVAEDHYIDRHYLDEYALYYCRNLTPPPNHVRRLHFFKTAFSEKDFESLLSRALGKELTDKDSELIKSYLGFVSVRPVLGVPVGRTILRRLPSERASTREIEATDSHTVHLANLKLSVEGLPFQQQDRAVGACATAALWSALGIVARRDGLRSPTPAEVTEAAARHILTDGRSLPANRGLALEQLCEAVRCCNLAAETVRADHHIGYFAAALHTYLRSGIPVLLALRNPGEGHAVTAAGFQLGDVTKPALESHLPFRSSRLEKIYVHDDRVGPYARTYFEPISFSKEYGEAIALKIDNEDWIVSSLLAPVYPKLRLSVESLIELAEITADLIESAVEGVGESVCTDLSVEFEYQMSGRFLQDLNGRIGKSEVDFLKQISLSRWCGIIRWYLKETPAFEFIWDTTDIVRDNGRNLLRAVLCLDGRYRPELETIAGQLGAPFASV